MMENMSLTSLLFLVLASLVVSSDVHKRVCYFTSWSKYRPLPARYTVASVEPLLCTHLIYAFAGFDGQGNIAPLEGSSELATYGEFNGLKSQNSELKTLLAVGGWNFGSKKFSLMAGDPVTRSRFVTSSVTFLRQHGFDGLDLDWEYPGARGGTAKDKANFVHLCKELKEAFESESSGDKRLILSAAVPASRALMDAGYDVQALDRYLDLWNVMTYDYHGAWTGKTGHNSPLHASQREAWLGSTLNMEWTVEEYVKRGASKHKVMVGLSTYGHSYKLTTPSRHEVGDTASLGVAGPFTRQPGLWAYYEVCKRMASGTGTVERDSRQKVPFFFDGDLWISFDDVESIQDKTRWLKKNGYGGYMTWTLDMDVFTTDLCPSVRSPYPLLSAANAVLSDPLEPGSPDLTEKNDVATTKSPQFGSGSGPVPGEQTTSDTPTATGSGSSGGIGSQTGSSSGSGTGGGSQTDSGSSATSGSGPQEFSCVGRPYKNYPDPSSPCRFIVCWADTPHYKTCPSGLTFDPQIQVCVNPQGELAC